MQELYKTPALINVTPFSKWQKSRMRPHAEETVSDVEFRFETT